MMYTTSWSLARLTVYSDKMFQFFTLTVKGTKGPIPLSGERLRMFANYANYLRNTHSSGGMDEWFIPLDQWVLITDRRP